MRRPWLVLAQKVQIRKEGARGAERVVYPVTKPPAVSGKVKIGVPQLQLHCFPQELYAVSVGLEKTNIRVAVDRKLRVRVTDAKLLKVSRRNPGGRDDDMIGRRNSQLRVEIRRAQNWPDFCVDTL